jgi:hypothetical protein
MEFGCGAVSCFCPCDLGEARSVVMCVCVRYVRHVNVCVLW